MIWNINKWKQIAEDQTWTEESLANVNQEYAYRINPLLPQNKRTTYNLLFGKVWKEKKAWEFPKLLFLNMWLLKMGKKKISDTFFVSSE